MKILKEIHQEKNSYILVHFPEWQRRKNRIFVPPILDYNKPEQDVLSIHIVFVRISLTLRHARFTNLNLVNCALYK